MTVTDRSPAPRIAFALLLVLSGFAGISYEILYGRLLGNLIGNQWAVTAAILITFLLGIGFGALYAHRLWRYLWLIEAGVGLYAAGFAFAGGLIETLLYSGEPVLGQGLASNLVRCVVLLAVPAFLIGCSLPLLAGYLSRLDSGLVFARAYALHTLGAALTVVLVEFWLLRTLGLQATVYVVAALNLTVAAALLGLFRDLRDAPPEPARHQRFAPNHLVALALASIASAVFQLWAVKMAEFLFGPFRETFALVLGLILFGIAIGAALTRRFGLRFDQIMFANLFGLVWVIGSFELIAELYAWLYPGAVSSRTGVVALKLGILFLLMGVPAITFGATIPALIRSQTNVARESGELLCISALANAAGFLLMLFALHPYLDYGVLAVVIAALSAAGLVAYLGGIPTAAAGVAALFGGAVIANLTLWNEQLLYLGHNAFHSPQTLKTKRQELRFPESFKGQQDVFALNWLQEGDARFFINGYISMNLHMANEQIVGAFSSLFAPRNDRALVLGLGSGATAATVGLLFDHTDTVEINPAVINNLHRMAEFNFDIQKRPNITIVQDDAMRFVKASRQRYSLIINTVTTPLYFSSSKMYTREFLAAAKQRLTPDGVYVTWLDNRVGDRGADIMLKTVTQTFPSCWMSYINSAYYLLLCSPTELALHQPYLAARNPLVSEFLLDKRGIPADALPYQVMNTEVARLIGDPGAPLNTLDYPALEFEMARLKARGIDALDQRLRAAMDPKRIEQTLTPAAEWDPLRLAVQADTVLGASHITAAWLEKLTPVVPNLDQLFQEAKAASRPRRAGGYAGTASSHMEYGYSMLLAKNYEQAIEAFKRALRIDPLQDDAAFYLAAAYEGQGQTELAFEYYARALKEDPDDSFVLLSIGNLHLQLKQYREALEYFDRGLANKAIGGGFYLRGQALQALGEIDKARRDYQKTLELEPSHEQARQALAALDAARGGQRP